MCGAFYFDQLAAFVYKVYKVFFRGKIVETSVLTLRVSNKIKSMLDKLAEPTQRTKSFLASEAIERYLEVEAWHVNQIKTALKEADNLDFISEKELAKLVKKYAG